MDEPSAGNLSHGSSAPAPSIPAPALTSGWAYLISAAIATLFCVADVLLPRGATAAIGYCIIPVIAGWTRRQGFLLGMTLLCTALTVIGYFTEPAGLSWWISLFDRAMVSGVLWLTYFLVRRRVIFIYELTEQTQALKAASIELRRSNVELERFASVVAHDLRGPLSTIGLLAELLTQYGSVKENTECTECVGSIRHELSRMSGFIQSLLTYGRAGAREVRRGDCDCHQIVSDVKMRLKADLDRCAARITTDPLPLLRADPVLMAELFQNLAENSMKYRSASPPLIHISAIRQGEAWLFSVRDNGVGIRPEDCEKIFAPFQQVHESNSPTHGVGLGLATCKRIVERHGGRIWARSQPGEGTTFLFTIPDPASKAGPPATSDADATGAITPQPQ